MPGTLRRRWRGALVSAGLVAFLTLNAVAYMHARRMTHFVQGGRRTASPEDLGTGAKVATLLTGVRVPRPRNRRDPESLGLPFETVTFLTRDSVEIEAWYVASSTGASELVILFHGYAAAKQSLLTEAQAFLGLGFDVLLIDHRGSGGSTGEVTSIGWHEAHDVEAALRYARDAYQPPRIVLFGTSMGAVAILRAIHVHGVEPDGVILEAPFNRMLDTTANRFHRMGLPSFPGAQLLLFWGGRQQGFDAFDHDPQAYVASVRCPALLLFGARDPDVTVEDAMTIVSRARSGVEHHTFEGAGHAPFLWQAETAWEEEVRGFLGRLEGDTGE